MTFRRILPSALVTVAAIAACAVGYAGAYAADGLSPSAAPAALSMQDSSAGATGTTAAATTADGDGTSVSVTTLTQAQFTSSMIGQHTCAALGSVRLCQDIETSRAHLPTWDIYADLGQVADLGDGGRMLVTTFDQQDDTAIPTAAAAGPFVKLHWSSSTTDITTGSATYTWLTVGSTRYYLVCTASELPDHAWTGVCNLQLAP